MSGQNPIVRPYCAGVRVGNWFEDVALEEDILRDYLDKRARHELICQKKAAISEITEQKVELSVSRDGNVHFGDVVMIVNPQPDDCSRCTHTLCITLAEDTIYNVKERLCAEVKDVVGSKTALKPDYRSAFVIRSCDGSHDGEVLRYYQPFYLATADGKQFLTSDAKTFILHSKMARHNKVWLGPDTSHLTEWRIVPISKAARMELEHTPVPANAKILFNHVKTNNCLCLEIEHFFSTYFGRENEISAFTWFDSRRIEFDQNHWLLVLRTPSSEILDVPPPADGMKECPKICQNPCVAAGQVEQLPEDLKAASPPPQ